jgi:hypothetical protein
VNLLSKIDYYNSSVVELQKSILKVKQKYLQYKKVELSAFPLFAVFASPIVFKALKDGDLYSHPYKYLLGVILILGLAYPIAIWIYKNWYEKKIKNTANFLQELNRFEKE